MSDLKSVSNDIQVPSAKSPDDFDNYEVPGEFIPPTEGWAIFRDWAGTNEDGAVTPGVLGAVAEGPDGWLNEAGWSTYDNTHSFSGGQCCRCRLRTDTLFNTFDWGGRVNFPSRVYEGEVVYFEMMMYFDDDFYWMQSTSNPILDYTKFLRFEVVDSGGTLRSSSMMQMRAPNLSADWRKTTSVEDGISTGSDIKFGRSDSIKRGQWQKFQVEIGVGKVSESLGGNGYYKFWVDGYRELYWQNRTLSAVNDDRAFSFFRFWNTFSPNDARELPNELLMWCDDMKIYNRRPSGWPT